MPILRIDNQKFFQLEEICKNYIPNYIDPLNLLINKKSQESTLQKNRIQELKSKTDLQLQEIENLKKQIVNLTDSNDEISKDNQELENKINTVKEQLEQLILKRNFAETTARLELNEHSKSLQNLGERINTLLEENRYLQQKHTTEVKQLNFEVKGQIAFQRKLRLETEHKLSELETPIQSSNTDISTDTDSCPPSEEEN